jgi:hypothetical protein
MGGGGYIYGASRKNPSRIALMMTFMSTCSATERFKLLHSKISLTQTDRNTIGCKADGFLKSLKI